MDAEQRKVLSKLVLGIRHLLEGYYDNAGNWHAGDLEQRLNQLGIWRNRESKPLAELPHLSEADYRARKIVDSYIDYRKESGVGLSDAVDEFVRESAYTWFNRLFALRCMEERGLIDEVIIQKEVYGGRSLKHNRLALTHPEICAGEDEGLFTLFEEDFSERSKYIPNLFNTQSSAIKLRPSVAALKRTILLLGGNEALNGALVTNDVFLAADTFGWAYQYWNTEEKNRVFERVRTENIKIEGKDIVPVTQLYTEPYIVKFLVQNSLGAQWMCMHPESKLYEKWEYYAHDAYRSRIEPKSISEITFMDPACGSGHFLLEAFDIFYDMYLKEGKIIEPENICKSILRNNLFGIDIDERAIQISEVVLWMKAVEKSSFYNEYITNLVACNIKLPKDTGFVDKFIKKYSDVREIRDLIDSIFDALQNADEIGSLLMIEEPVKDAFESLRSKYGAQTMLFGPTSEEDWNKWKIEILSKIAEHFNQEASSIENEGFFFGHSASKGLKIFNLLSNSYDVVSTNPPYMGSRNMGSILKEYIKANYPLTKRDLFASFIYRCQNLAKKNGIISMVTQNSWLFLTSYSEFRNNKKYSFHGILNDTKIQVLTHLGTNAFEEISGEIVNIVLFTLKKEKIDDNHRILSFRLINQKNPVEKNKKLLQLVKEKESDLIFKPLQKKFLTIKESPICYWLSEKLIDILTGKTVNDVANVVQGLITSNDNRFVRYLWEVNLVKNKRWILFEKGGGYGRWFGHHYWVVDWEYNGSRIRNTKNPRVQNEFYYFKEGYTYSATGSGNIGLRMRDHNSIFSNKSSSIIMKNDDDIPNGLSALINSRISNYLIRSINSGIDFTESYVSRLPIFEDFKRLIELEREAINAKQKLIELDILENSFNYDEFEKNNDLLYILKYSTILTLIEGKIENIIFKEYELNEHDKDLILNEMGLPVSWFNIIDKYDDISKLNDVVNLNKIINISNNKTIINEVQLSNLKKSIKKYYETYNTTAQDYEFIEEDDLVVYGDKTLPSDTIIETLCKDIQINPISLYNILEEGIKKENWINQSLLKKIKSDFITVQIFTLLGHSWELTTEKNSTKLTDPDGIISLTQTITEKTLYQRLQQQIINKGIILSSFLKEFEILFGQTLEEWLLFDFFKYHVQQFLKRPVVWHLRSNPTFSKRRLKTEPGFSCLIHYQKINKGTLSKIITQYENPLKERYIIEYNTLKRTGILTELQSKRYDELEELIDELEHFQNTLSKVISDGFNFEGMTKLLDGEPLDEWTSIDGVAEPPSNYNEFVKQESTYNPNINDGVRVNIAPLQKAELLAADVLSKKDIEQAIRDRAEWRRDERYWCRQGRLPQPGWWANKEE